MIFLSKGGTDKYMNMLAAGAHVSPTNTDDFVYNHSREPIVLRGILKHKIMKQCWNDGRTFYYMDTGYFGNEVNSTNPRGYKLWHRIAKNNLQHTEIISRPDDRWLKHNRIIPPWKKSGRKILVLPPGEKPAKFYGIDTEQWIDTILNTLAQHTDRPVEIRSKPGKRGNRVLVNTFEQALDNDVFAVVAYNTIAATESILHSIPVFTVAPNAADPVACKDLAQIETPYYADSDKLYAWACHLAYGQFHISELKNGTAYRIINEH
jgi:hypothetical protein